MSSANRRPRVARYQESAPSGANLPCNLDCRGRNETTAVSNHAIHEVHKRGPKAF